MTPATAHSANQPDAKSKGSALHEIVAYVADSDTEAALEGLAAQQQAGPIHTARGTVRDAIRFIDKLSRSPRLLIVDISQAELPLSEIDALAEACEPSVSVVVLGERQDVGLFRELMRLGVADYLVKPILPDLIAPYLAGAHPRLSSHSNRTGKVVAIAGARGGVGVSTIATGIAWNLANRDNRRCVLIDLNPYGGGIGVQLGIEGGGLVDALENANNLDALFLERALTQHGPRLSVLTAEQPMDTDMPMADKAVEALIQTLERQFHYVIIDLPRLPGSLYAYILRRAGVRVLVADRTVPGVRDLTRMLGLMDDTAGRSILVLNDSRPQSEGLAERTMIEDTIGRPFDVRLAYDKAMSRVVDNLGEPLASVGGVFADGVRELTNVLSGQHGKRRKGWLQLVRGR